mmetsp:Transcript_82915/g.231214  ORF Transcript_82915/g.231214 Transcript_82915/m.231214 type:complete len:239 (-) Transcript_82915:359-1075(-)
MRVSILLMAILRASLRLRSSLRCAARWRFSALLILATSSSETRRFFLSASSASKSSATPCSFGDCCLADLVSRQSWFSSLLLVLSSSACAASSLRLADLSSLRSRSSSPPLRFLPSACTAFAVGLALAGFPSRALTALAPEPTLALAAEGAAPGAAACVSIGESTGCGRAGRFVVSPEIRTAPWLVLAGVIASEANVSSGAAAVASCMSWCCVEPSSGSSSRRARRQLSFAPVLHSRS